MIKLIFRWWEKGFSRFSKRFILLMLLAFVSFESVLFCIGQITTAAVPRS